MALSNADKAQVRYYLGYSGRFYQVTTVLEQAMIAIDTDADIVTLIQSILVTLADVDTRITDALSRLKALRLEGDAVLPGMGEIGGLRSHGRMYAGRMAAILGVPIVRNPFSTSNGGADPSLGSSPLDARNGNGEDF